MGTGEYMRTGRVHGDRENIHDIRGQGEYIMNMGTGRVHGAWRQEGYMGTETVHGDRESPGDRVMGTGRVHGDRESTWGQGGYMETEIKHGTLSLLRREFVT